MMVFVDPFIRLYFLGGVVENVAFGGGILGGWAPMDLDTWLISMG